MASIKGVSIDQLQYMETSRGIMYNASVYVDGEKVGMVENQGNGGCTYLQVPRQVEQDIEKRSVQYYTERPSDSDGVESFMEEVISYYEHEKDFKDLQEKEPDKALGLIYKYARTDDTSGVMDIDELIPKKYKVPVKQAMAFIEKHGQDKSEVFTSLEDFNLYPYNQKRLPIPDLDNENLLLQDLVDEKEYFCQHEDFRDVMYQGITVKCNIVIVKQTHVQALDDTTLVFDLSVIPYLSASGTHEWNKGEQYGQYTLRDLFAIGYAIQKILLSENTSPLKGKAKLYRKGELVN